MHLSYPLGFLSQGSWAWTLRSPKTSYAVSRRGEGAEPTGAKAFAQALVSPPKGGLLRGEGHSSSSSFATSYL